MKRRALSMEMTVQEALDRWPALTLVFVRRHMACVGCAMAQFERLSDVARIYGVPATSLFAAMRRAVRAQPGQQR